MRCVLKEKEYVDIFNTIVALSNKRKKKMYSPSAVNYTYIKRNKGIIVSDLKKHYHEILFNALYRKKLEKRNLCLCLSKSLKIKKRHCIYYMRYIFPFLKLIKLCKRLKICMGHKVFVLCIVFNGSDINRIRG